MYLLRNPTLEDQALARIHRIGQTKEVTTVRFIVKDSFEEVRIEVNMCFEYILRTHRPVHIESGGITAVQDRSRFRHKPPE